MTEDSSSSFTFLTKNTPLEESPDPIDSPNTPQEEKSRFSFLQPELHDNEQESHDTKQESHDAQSMIHDKPPEIIAEPVHDPQTKSPDRDAKSHDSKSSPISKPAPRQLAPTKVKKKKKRAVRPGQNTKDEPSDLDTVSLSSHTSSHDSSHTEEAVLSPDPQPKSHDLSVAQLVQLDSQEDIEKPTDSEIPDNVTMATDKVVSEEVLAKDEESMDPEVPKQETPPKTPPTEVEAKPQEGVSEELTEVFTQPNYSVELSDSDRLTALLEGFESGLARIRYSSRTSCLQQYFTNICHIYLIVGLFWHLV